VRRVIRALLVLVGMLGAGLALGAWLLLRASLPQVDGTATVAGLSAPVTVIRDHAGVPHVFGSTAADVVRGLGFVQAQDRRFQMELARRAGQGRMAEVLGDRPWPKPVFVAGVLAWSMLDLDQQMRTLGLARVAAAEAAVLPEEEGALFQAYADGVNAATDLAGRAALVRILGVAPEPWTPADSILLARLGDLSFAIQRFEELTSATLLREVGQAGLDALMPPYPDELAPPLVGGDGPAPPASAAGLLLPLRHAGLVGPTFAGAGSDNWVLGAARTTTGGPILASDPHIPVDIPMYVAHLSAPGFEVAGMTAYGPTFLIGHNDRIAWGVTLVGADTEDYFVEEIVDGNPPRVHTPDGWQPLTIRHEAIRVRGREAPVDWVVREGPHGPLVTDLDAADVRKALGGAGTPGATYASALAWTGCVVQPAASYSGVARARDWTTFRAALANHPGAPVNFVYADVDGHVGYQMAGRVPTREGPAPVTPVPGWEKGHAWTGTIPFESMPSLYDPPDGAIVTANARITGPRYPYHIATRWADVPYRTRRIRARLDAQPKHSIADNVSLQMDVHAEALGPVADWARAVKSDDPQIRRFQDALVDWNLEIRADSPPALLVDTFRLELLHTFFERKLSADAFRDYLFMNSGLHLVALTRIMDDPRATFFGSEPETAVAARAAAVEQAIRRTIARLEAALGADWDAWSWGRLHAVAFEHPLTRSGSPLAPVLGWFLNVGPFPAPGNSFTVNAGYWWDGAPFKEQMAPMYRQVVDLKDLRGSRWTPGPPGVSELRWSSHYGDLAEPWLRGYYRPMLWTRQDVDADAESTLTLTPAR